MLTYENITDSYHGWSKRTGIQAATIKTRIDRGWSPERALMTPTRRRYFLDRENETKKCSGCHKVKPITEFYFRSKRPDQCESKCKACEGERGKLRRQERRAQVIAHYSQGANACALCSESRIGVLDVDHINGDGAEHRQEVHASALYYTLIREGFPEGYRILCRNCNWLAYKALRGWDQ